MSTETAPSTFPKKSHWRWLAWAVACVVFLVVAVIVALLTVGGNLGSPRIKDRIVHTAASFGVAVNYDEASVSPTSLHIAGLRVSQPAPDSAGLPLVSIDRIDARFSGWGAVTGGKPIIREIL